MRIELYVNGKKIRFFINAGWYKGNPFSLIKIELFTKPEYQSIYIIDITILKLCFLLGFDWDMDK